MWKTWPEGLSRQKPRPKAEVFVRRYWGPRAMFFTRHRRPWSNPIITHLLIDFFFQCFIHINMNFDALKWAIFAHFMVAREIALLLWTGCQGTQMNNCHENLKTCFTGLNGILWNKILVAMENFEKCTVAMLGGPCSQHVTGNTSRLNQHQSAIICTISWVIDLISNKIEISWFVYIIIND